MKPNILRECQRILKPGGKIVFLYDVETENPLICRYKYSNRPLYNKLFIEDAFINDVEVDEELSGAHTVATDARKSAFANASPVDFDNSSTS